MPQQLSRLRNDFPLRNQAPDAAFLLSTVHCSLSTDFLRGFRMSHRTYLNLIGGEWLPARTGKTFLNMNPADHSDVVGEFPASGPEDVNLAVAAAKKAFATWRLVPAPKRAEILYRAGSLLVE